MGNNSLLQGIFPIQGSSPGLLHCRQILDHLSHQESPLSYKSSSLATWGLMRRVGCDSSHHFLKNNFYQGLQARKGRGTRDQIANIHWITEKAREFQKNIYFCFIDYAKAFDCVDHNKLWNILSDGNSRPSNLHLEKSMCRSGSNSWNRTWNNRLVPNWERSMSRLYIVTLLI